MNKITSTENSMIKTFFSDKKVTCCKLIKETNCVEISVSGTATYTDSYIRQLEAILAKSYGVSLVKVTYSLIQTDNKVQLSDYIDHIKQVFSERARSSYGFMKNSSWSVDGNSIYIKLGRDCATFLKSMNYDRIIHDIVFDLLGINCNVSFIDKSGKESTNLLTEENPADNSGHLKALDLSNVDLNYKAPEAKKASKKPKDDILVQTMSNRARAKVNVDDGAKKATSFIGRDITLEITPISGVNTGTNAVAIFGKIISTEVKPLKTGAYLFTIDVTDYTSSIKVKFFIKEDKIDSVQQQVTVDKAVYIQGEPRYDNYLKEDVIQGQTLKFGTWQEREDNATEKRCELHMHTAMSAMDGITPVQDLLKTAERWGHRAVAITDHGVLQSYDDAFKFKEKKGLKLKILYGMEGYLFDEPHLVMFNYKFGDDLNRDYVVFDLETTGLYKTTDRIIEIGAVRYAPDGTVRDRFSTFVNPEISIPESSYKIHGISDSMVADAPTIETVLPEFVRFMDNAILVAHNAPFDVGFIEENCHRLHLPWNDPVYIDTCELARRLITSGITNYKLDTVAEYLGVELENHHRAVDDCVCCGGILFKLLERLEQSENYSQLPGIAKMNNLPINTKVQTYHVILLVKNPVGLKNLYRLVTASNLNYFHRVPRIPRRLLEMYRDGLIVGSACEAGELFRAMVANKPDSDLNKIASFYDYLEIQPIDNNRFMVREGVCSGDEDLRNFNRKILTIGDRLGKPVVATGDVHFLNPNDEVFRRIIMYGKGFTDADKQAELYFKTTEEMLMEFSYLGLDRAREVVITNPNMIADIIDDNIRPIPKGMHPPKLENSENELREICRTRAYEVYGDPLPDLVKDRLETELDAICNNGYSVMYMIAQKLVYNSQSNGHKVDSRGSVGSSFVANMSGITEVNALPPHYVCPNCKHSEFFTNGEYHIGFDMPSKNCPHCGIEMRRDGHNIPFETFLGFTDNVKIPDIDLNFSGEYQSKAMKYIEVLFSKENVFRAGTISTVADKTAFGYVTHYNEDHDITMSAAEVHRLQLGCMGTKRSTGQHPGGIIVVPREYDVHDFTPLQHPADDVNSDIITTHFAFSSLHDTILKLDILGHTAPTMLRYLTTHTGVAMEEVPMFDKDVIKLFTSVEPLGLKPGDIESTTGTLGLPESGTKFVRGMLMDCQPKSFFDLLQISGLSHGTDVWLGNGKDLITNGTCTISELIACRDDIMTYLILKGLPPALSFTIMEGVRKGRGIAPDNEKLMREHGVPDWYIDSCKKIKYMFPKAHAVAYSMAAQRLGWFKLKYPAHFYAAYYTVSGTDFDLEWMANGMDKNFRHMKDIIAQGKKASPKDQKSVGLYEVVDEMYHRGIGFTMPDIMRSHATNFLVLEDNMTILPPLVAVPGLGEQVANEIVEDRTANGLYSTVEEVGLRVSKLSSTLIDIMHQIGALGDLPNSQQMSLFDEGLF